MLNLESCMYRLLIKLRKMKRNSAYATTQPRCEEIYTEVGLPEYEGAHVKQSAESKAKESCSIGGRKSTRAFIVSSFAIGVLSILLLLTTLIVTSVKIPERIMNQFQCKSLTGPGPCIEHIL